MPRAVEVPKHVIRRSARRMIAREEFQLELSDGARPYSAVLGTVGAVRTGLDRQRPTRAHGKTRIVETRKAYTSRKSRHLVAAAHDERERTCIAFYKSVVIAHVPAVSTTNAIADEPGREDHLSSGVQLRLAEP